MTISAGGGQTFESSSIIVSRKGTRGREIVLQLKADGDDYLFSSQSTRHFFKPT